MLVLTRKVGERINIGDDIIVSVLEVSRGNVRIGIEAPGRVPIHRNEVYERLKEQNKLSSRGNFADVAEAAKLMLKKGLKE